ncbi:MAG: hypothetical protein P4M09_28515 [Devosia sp.]|nr:hypothetical protein [Devosia sp.]
MLFRIAAIAGIGLLAALAVSPAQALSSHDCSVKYKAAQDAGTLNGMKYADFRKANCGSDTPTDTTGTTAAPSTAAADPGEPNVTNTEHSAEPAAPSTTAPKGVVFPSKIDPKYASETPGKQRMHTCLDQYHTNKANNALGGLKWIQKGGGYYSLCNAKLKAS